MTDIRAQLQAALGDVYALDREFGGSGRSRIFLATEIRLGRVVVIKVVTPEEGSELFADRFAREVKFATRLQHAHIVPLLGAGVAGTLAYYTTPYVEGPSLRSRMAGGERLPLTEATQILRDVASALAYAHDQGVLHRDLRPEHILLGEGAALVTDFGIAKAMSASHTMEFNTESLTTTSETLTSVGSAYGSPAYMSPEQAAGSVVDARSDLYAWGVTAYEILSGAHPFAEYATPQALMAAHLTERPVPLGERAPQLPKALVDIVMACLEKDADARPDSADAVLLAIDGAPAAPAAPTAASEGKRRRTTREVTVVDEDANDEAREARAAHDAISRRMVVAAAMLVIALLLWGWFSRAVENGARTTTPSTLPPPQ
ncbi:MAG: serine/threonine protein kinase [Gemmatimonadaceae bacterium]|nr:serine/threonine protein kinase [Gemmatimonadaceae bacterium]